MGWAPCSGAQARHNRAMTIVVEEFAPAPGPGSLPGPAAAGRVIAAKCNVPVLYSFELSGTDTDIDRVTAGLDKFRGMECSTTV